MEKVEGEVGEDGVEEEVVVAGIHWAGAPTKERVRQDQKVSTRMEYYCLLHQVS